MIVFFPTQFQVIYTINDSYFQHTAFADWSF